MNKLLLDLGNYDAKYLAGSQEVKNIRSMYAVVNGGMKTQPHNEKTPLIGLNGKSYHLGDNVNLYRASSRHQLVEGDKAEMAQIFTLGCAGQFPDGALEVVISTPDPEKDGDRIIQQLKRNHQYQYNGLQKVHTITKVSVIEENRGAYMYARRNGMVPNTGMVIVIDIGAGTVIAKLYTSEGVVVDTLLMQKSGCYQLANDLCMDSRLKAIVGTAPNPGMVMEGLANGTNRYSQIDGSEWTSYLEDYRSSWWKRIRNAVISNFADYKTEVRRILITGGGALLIPHQTKQTIQVVPAPRHANILGLQEASNATV